MATAQFLKQHFSAKTKALPIRIGGGASLIPSKADLANYLTVSQDQIKNFAIVGDLVIANVVGSYAIGTTPLTFENDTDIRYFETDKNAGIVGQTAQYFTNSSLFYVNIKSEGRCSNDDLYFNSNLKYGFFEFADTLEGKRAFKNLKNTRIYLPNLLLLDREGSGASYIFKGVENVKIYVNPSAPTFPIPPGLTRINIQNTTTPNAVTDLSTSEIGGTYIKLSFTEIPNADFYELWQKKNGRFEFVGEISNNTDAYFTRLAQQTQYQFKIATCDQYYNGSGFFDNENDRAFSNTITATTTQVTPAFTDIPTNIDYTAIQGSDGDVIGISSIADGDGDLFADKNTTFEFKNVIIPSDPIGLLFECGGSGAGMAISFDTNNLVVGAGDGDTTTITDYSVFTSIPHNSFQGQLVDIYLSINPTSGKIKLWVFKAETNTLIDSSTNTALTSPLGIDGTNTFYCGTGEVGVGIASLDGSLRLGVNGSDFNGTMINGVKGYNNYLPSVF